MSPKASRLKRDKVNRLKSAVTAGKSGSETKGSKLDPALLLSGGKDEPFSPTLMSPKHALQLQSVVGNRAVRSILIQMQGGAPPRRYGRARPSRKTRRIIKAVKRFRSGIQQPHTKASLEGYIVAVLTRYLRTLTGCIAGNMASACAMKLKN